MERVKLQGFPPKCEVEKAEKEGYPIVLSPSTSALCNLACTYCCTNAGKKLPGELKTENHIKAIREFNSLHNHKKYIFIAGMGEPFLDESLFPIIEQACELDIYIVIFTNMTMINEETAQKLVTMEKISIIGKLNSLNSKLQEKMAGSRDFFEERKWDYVKNVKIPKNLKILIDAGFNNINNGYTRLGVDIIITKENYRDIPAVVSFCVENSIHPVLDTMIPIGKAEKNYSSLKLEPDQNRELYQHLIPILGSDFVKNEFSGNPCSVFRVGIAYDNFGNIKMCCSDRETNIWNIKNNSLKTIYSNITEKRKRFFAENRIVMQNGLFPECPMSNFYRRNIVERQTII